ncbi:MAG: hypothetical protein M1836_005680 [Candelina mexicana]|nr:MAG: hypothetical protein M1836_005680 [Candelina mexicana]
MHYHRVPLALVTLLSIASATPTPRCAGQHDGFKGWVPGGASGPSSVSPAPVWSSTPAAQSTGGTTNGGTTSGATNNGDTSGTTGSSTPGATSNGTTTSGSTAGASVSTKKGTGTWFVTKMHASWGYDWHDHPKDSAPAGSNADLVPMINPSSDLGALKASSYKEILGYNEPDAGNEPDSGHVDVQAAIKQWPDVVATGKRVGSPASATLEDMQGGWFDQFMTGIAKAGSHVDFICLHHYSPDGDISKFRSYIERVYAKYKLPIWVTEWSYINYSTNPPSVPSTDAQVQYMKDGVKMLNSLDYVERFLWCGLPNNDMNLQDRKGNLTPMGTTYATL